MDRGGPRGPLAPASVHSYIRTVNGFLNWAGDTKGGGMNVHAKGKLPKLPKKLVNTLTRAEIQRIEDAAQTERDALIIRLLADTGMRVGELCGLRVDSLVRHDRDFLQVVGQSQGGGAKNDTFRLVAIDAWISQPPEAVRPLATPQ
jgi:integrase